MTLIYHITHVANLEGIINASGLWCDAERLRQGFSSTGIAHDDLKNRRTRTVVTAAAGGNLADYVPFYFANRSPMLYSIHTGFVSGYDSGQKYIIYLVSPVERVVQGKRPWCFTDGHAVEAIKDSEGGFYTNLEELKRIDWEVITSWRWKNTLEDPDRRRHKQAEFLVHQSFPWSWVESIGVMDAEMKKEVSAILADAQPCPPVRVQRKWYYD